MSKYKRILIAIDGLDMTDSVVNTALEWVDNQTEVYLVNVVDFPGTLGAINEDAIINKDIETAKELLTHIVQKHPNLMEQAKKVNQRVVVGNPHQMIAKDLIKEHDIDLIVIGKTSQTSLMDKIFIGSTAKAIVEDAMCDVIVVKTPYE